jgi:hypothetical protein
VLQPRPSAETDEVLAAAFEASKLTAANVGLVVAIALLTVHGWLAGPPSYGARSLCSPPRSRRGWAW